MIIAWKISRIPNSYEFVGKINKIPEFYAIFVRKMPEFYDFFFLGGGLPTLVSYANVHYWDGLWRLWQLGHQSCD